MNTTQIESRLKTVGATNAEAELLSEIMYLNGWHLVPAYKLSENARTDLQTWLADFREERALIAANNERTRQARIAAGYR